MLKYYTDNQTFAIAESKMIFEVQKKMFKEIRKITQTNCMI